MPSPIIFTNNYARNILPTFKYQADEKKMILMQSVESLADFVL